MTLPPDRPRPLDPGARPAIQIVVDACVFPRSAWVGPIVSAARAGHIQPYWSPKIIAEASRVLTRIWLARFTAEGLGTSQSVRRLSVEAHAWFERMSEVFHVVDDRPPHEPAWEMRDVYDRHLWTAAKRAGARTVITQNLKDGPPPNDAGVRVWENTVYLHPRVFVDWLDWLGDLVETKGEAVRRGAEPPTAGIPLSPEVEAFLRSVVGRWGAGDPE